jgi:type I pantothenate kinase
VILEGLNVLQTGRANRRSRALLSDYLDFSLYLDADTDDIARWFEERFAVLRRTAFTDPRSHFKAYAAMSDEDAMAFCRRVWREINLVNLEENILATRARADAIVEKGPDHRVRRVRLRRV